MISSFCINGGTIVHEKGESIFLKIGSHMITDTFCAVYLEARGML